MACGKIVDSLPDELLLEIFSYFSTEQLAMTVQHVSCRWKEVSQDNSLWKNKAYSPETTTTDDEIIQHLQNMPMLKKFSPKRGLKTKKIINTICNNCKNIQHLEFSMYQRLSLHAVKQIVQAFPDLAVLHVPLYNNVDHLKFFSDIGKLKKLITLDFTKYYVAVNKNVLSILADECLSLQHVNLGDCEFEDQDIRYFLEKKRYQLLSFTVYCYISSVTYKALIKCANLECLRYGNYNEDLPNMYVHKFSKLSKLKKLCLYAFREQYAGYIGGIFAKNALIDLISLEISWCWDLQADLLNEIFKNCPVLEEFILEDDKVEGSFKSIGNCRKLEKLTLNCYELAAEEFEYIASGCRVLKYLHLARCKKITDKEFEHICIGCPLLEHLEMHELYELTDITTESLFKCKNLKSLSIMYNHNITGVQLIDISTHLTHLQKLQIFSCERFDKEIIGKLQTKMPQLTIKHDHESEEIGSYSDIDLEDVQFLN